MAGGWHRGTTPTNIFKVNIDLRGATVFVSYSQRDKVIIEKTGSDLTITENTIEHQLTQEETLLLRPGTVKIQIRYVKEDGTADASNIISTTSEDILKDGVIEFV